MVLSRFFEFALLSSPPPEVRYTYSTAVDECKQARKQVDEFAQQRVVHFDEAQIAHQHSAAKEAGQKEDKKRLKKLSAKRKLAAKPEKPSESSSSSEEGRQQS